MKARKDKEQEVRSYYLRYLRGILLLVYVTTLLESYTQPFKVNLIGEWWTERIWKMFFRNDWDALSAVLVWGWGQLQEMPVFIGCVLSNIRTEPLPNTSIKHYRFWGVLLAWWELWRTGKHMQYFEVNDTWVHYIGRRWKERNTWAVLGVGCVGKSY
jgi:hypothetical protein